MANNIDRCKLIRKTVRSLISKPLFRILPDEFYLRIAYWAELNKKLNLRNPKTFNEKMQWLKINNRRDQYSIHVDKYRVREYIKEVLGAEYLIPLIQSCDSVSDIDWESLPQQFVIKCNHGSGSNIVCKDKSKLNVANSQKKLNKWMRNNWFWFGREWPYKNVKEKIIIEEYLQDDEQPIPKDYKLWVFNGKVKFINVHFQKNNETYINIYDLDWNLQPFGMVFKNDLSITHKRPKYLNKMIEFAERLGKDKQFVRIDFYEVNDQIYFGEITFFPTSGFIRFYPNHDELDKMYGEMLNLRLESFD